MIIILGGVYYVQSTNVELVDIMPEEPTTCNIPAKLPKSKYYAVGAMINHVPMICAGPDNSYCYRYTATNNSWAKTSDFGLELMLASSAVMGQDEWFISGGILDAGSRPV